MILINLDKIRKDTLHVTDKIFLSSAGCSLPPKIVFERMHAYNRLEEQYGGYSVEAKMATERNKFYIEASKLLNCKPENISFQYSATEGFSRALSAVPFAHNQVILTTDDDYISNFIAFYSLEKRFGIRIVRAKNNIVGELDIADFERKIIDFKPKLVAITHVPTNSGLVQPVEAVGLLCKKYDILYLLDACQAVGQLKVDVQAIGCDFLNGTGRKFLRGPRTSGFLYVSDKALAMDLEPLFIDRRGASWSHELGYTVEQSALRFEPKEIGVEIVGLAEALQYCNEIGIENIENACQDVGKRLRENLAKIPDLTMLDQGKNLCNIITFTSKTRTQQQIEDILQKNQVFYSMSFRSFALIDFNKKNVDWAVRFSPHYFNTLDEMDKVADLLNQ